MSTRSARLGHALVPAAVGAALAGLAQLGAVPLTLGVAAVQVILLLGLLAVLDAPEAVPVFLLGTAAAAAADLVVVLDDGRVAGLAAVVALALVAGIVQQLARRHRSRVTESLADMLSAVLLVCAAACLPAVQQAADGDWLLPAGLFGVTAALVSGRLLQAWLPSQSSGLLLLLPLAVGTAAAAGLAEGELRTRLLIGLCVAVTAVLADVVASLAASDVAGHGPNQQRVAALRPVTQLLPFALSGPVLLVAARLLERG